jgi:hypothetical protein
VETYILMGICLITFVGTIVLFRFIISDPDQANLIGGAAGLLLGIAAGGAYFKFLSASSMF